MWRNARIRGISITRVVKSIAIFIILLAFVIACNREKRVCNLEQYFWPLKRNLLLTYTVIGPDKINGKTGNFHTIFIDQINKLNSKILIHTREEYDFFNKTRTELNLYSLDLKNCTIKKNGKLILKGPIRVNQKWKEIILSSGESAPANIKLKKMPIDCKIDKFININILNKNSSCAEVKCQAGDYIAKPIFCYGIGYVGLKEGMKGFGPEEWSEKIINIQNGS